MWVGNEVQEQKWPIIFEIVDFFKTDFTNYLLSFINVENFKETASVEPAIGEEVRQGENGK